MRASLRTYTLIAVGLLGCSDDAETLQPGNGGRIAGPDAILPRAGAGGVSGAGAAGAAGAGAAGAGAAGSAGSTAGTSGGGAAGTSGGSAGAGASAGASGAAGSGGTAGAGGTTGAGAGGAPVAGAGGGGAAGSSAGAGGGGASGGTAGAGGAPSNAITIETFNVALAGVGVEYLEARRQPNYDAIAASPADVICLQEAWQQIDKDGFIAAAKATHPNAYFAATDNTTPYTDDRDLNGASPPAPAAPPCAAATTAPKLDTAIACAATNCSTTGDASGYITTLDCVKTKCVVAAIGLLNGSADDKRCYGCFAPQLASEKLSDIKNICTTQVRDGVAYQGQSSPLLLSRYPLKNQQTYVLPAAWFRRVILKATVTHPTKGDVDVYCNHTNPIYAASLLYPYTSQHGAGGASANPWENEHALHVKRTIEWVDATSGAKPAIIAGDFNASFEFKDGNGTILTKADGATNLKMLTDAFVIAQAASYTPTCTFCSENPLIPTADKGPYTPEWLDYVFLKGIPASSTLTSERIYTAFSVTAKKTGDPSMNVSLPLSDHYGYRVTVALP